MDIGSDYEKDMESNWAIVGLEKEVQKAKDRQLSRERLMKFLDDHEDFKMYYELMKGVDKY
jgi:hypothetical protein